MASRAFRVGVSLVVAAVVLSVLVAGAVWWGWWQGEPAGSEVASPTPEPEGTEGEEDDGTLDGLAPLAGYAAVDDPPQDVADESGVAPPEPEPAADLRQVEVEGDGEALTITFHVQDRVPILTSSLAWSLDVYMPAYGDEDADDGEHEGPDEDAEDEQADGEEPVEGALPEDLVYTVTVQQAGQERMTAVMDWESSAQTSLDAEPDVDEDTITVTVPAQELERLDGPFEWQALGQLDGAYEDYAPDGGRAEFPQEEASPTPSPTPPDPADDEDG